MRGIDIFLKGPDWQPVVYAFAMKAVREQGEIHDPESWFNSDAVDHYDAWLLDDGGAVLLLGQSDPWSARPLMPQSLTPFFRPDAPMAAPVR